MFASRHANAMVNERSTALWSWFYYDISAIIKVGWIAQTTGVGDADLRQTPGAQTVADLIAGVTNADSLGLFDNPESLGRFFSMTDVRPVLIFGAGASRFFSEDALAVAQARSQAEILEMDLIVYYVQGGGDWSLYVM
ncbi:hypothetical protein BD779DRAFT_1473689 [Infundibulicybe gibba]|nr:hypothetical protein BD779DRAFT_1473689 [Infundibulicybe gibba]